MRSIFKEEKPAVQMKEREVQTIKSVFQPVYQDESLSAIFQADD